MKPRTSPLRSGGRPKSVNRTRKASEFARCYGSKARVEWMKKQRCVVHTLGCVGPIDNVHTATGGVGRKADASTIVPMCNHLHRKLHTMGAETFQRTYCVDLRAEAARIQTLWEARCRD